MAKKQILNYVFHPGIGANDNNYPNAYSLLSSNKSFIQKEMSAYIVDKVTNADQYTPTDADYTPSTGVMVITIGSHNFNVGDAILIATAGLTFRCELDSNATLHPYPRATGVPNDSGSDPSYNKAVIITAVGATTITVNVGISSNTSVHTFDSAAANAISDVFFNYENTSVIKCERDVGYIIDAYLYDLRYGGNQKTRFAIAYYWDQDVAQVDGDRGAELSAHNFIGRLINDYIFTNTVYSALNVSEIQVTDITKVYESAAASKITTLVGNTVSVIANGLTSMPAAETTGIGFIKIQGKYDTSNLLLITNTTKNEIIYNFSQSATGGIVTVKDHGYDSDFVSYLQTTDGVTTIELNYNTSLHSATDDIQIFVEVSEVKVRPYDFGTDAIERMRIANPQSMLDADFEYGLQPTKWSAIATMRGYPSVYEIPGTDTAVVSVTTDASIGTDGIGQSLITVTTVGPHNFNPGTPITIKALENSVSGAARAEGSFVIVTVPTTTTFTFYAKAKVGSSNGEVLSTDYTQLREAGFYTGASIGRPNVTVSSNGYNGSMTTTLITPAGSNKVSFSGSVPEIGAPLSNASINLGTQVTGIAGSGGTVVTPIVVGSYAPGVTSIDVASAAGIVPGLAINRGDGISIYVSSIVDNTINFDSATTNTIIGNTQEYIGISGVNQVSAGINANFNVTKTSGVYACTLNAAGTGYAVGDRIVIPGAFLDGSSPTHNLSILISAIGGSGEITTFTFTGTGFNGTGTVSGISTSVNGGLGTNSIVDVTYTNNSYSVSIPSLDTSEGYIVNDQLKLSGTTLGGQTPANDLILKVASRETVAGKALLGALISGGSGYVNGLTLTTTGGTGTNLTVTVSVTAGAVTSFTITNPGTGYSQGDTITMVGGSNDATFSITSASRIGQITGITFTGSAPDASVNYTNVAYTSNTAGGSGAQVDVNRFGVSYIATFGVNPGTGYLPGETITVLGTQLGGTSPTNNLTITISSVGGSGEISGVTVSGTAANTATYLFRSPINIVGNGAAFNVDIAAGGYTANISNAGIDYAVGQTFTIQGTSLNGASPANDLTITIQTVDAAGSLTSVSAAGTAVTGNGTFNAIAGTNEIPVGIGALFDITRSAGGYSAVLNAGGAGYNLGNRILVAGTLLGGTSPTNDLLIRVSGIGASNTVTTFTQDAASAITGSLVPFRSTITLSEVTNNLIGAGSTITFTALATLEATFENAHGLVPGNTFIVTVASDDGANNHNLAAGSFLATEIPNVNSLRYVARAVGNINTASAAIDGAVYPRPDSFFIHRPFDGGVQLGTGGPQHGAQAIRQSKKYIRYQSGKGIMYTTGALFAPSYDLRSITSNGVEVGSLITVETDDNDHGVQLGGIIRILGVETPGYNSGRERGVPPDFDYEVVDVVDERTFRILAQRRLGSTTGKLGFGSQMSVVSWHGATVRSGIFDDQNGIFWEYDGTNISVNQRTGTKQLAGTVAIQSDNNLVTGTNTRFLDQVKAGDRFIIKGMTHVVSHVNSNSELTVTPDFRGIVDVLAAKANLVVDKKVKQQDFNLDRLDGTGPSGYDIDIAKMQMIGIQYSWYGAGFIDFMLRGSDGNFVFCHRMRNSNINTEAFMRSGNLPVRYEVTNEGPPGQLAAAMDATQTSLVLTDSSFFPQTGYLYIDNEIMSFSANNIATNTLTGLARAAALSNFQSGAQRNYTAGPAAIHTSSTGVILVSNTITPLISHWGSAFLTDGGFDEDRGYIFSYSATGIEISTTKTTSFLIRLAPSVSNAIVGDLGERELLNRAQLLLQGIEVTSDGEDDAGTKIRGGIVIEGVLNPQNYPANPADISWGGLSNKAQGGQPSFAQIAAGGGVEWGASTATATATVSANIDTGFVYNGFQNGERSTPLPLTLASYNAAGPVYAGVLIYSQNPDAYSPANGNYYVTQVRVENNRVDITYRANSGTTQSTTTQSTSTTYKFIQPTYTGRVNRLLFTQASWEAAGASIGTPVSATDTNWPAGTAVSNVEKKQLGSVIFYDVQFNNTSIGSIAAGNAVTFEFGTAGYAEPGETVFSFIAVPGERSQLNLGELKELTNTTLGGRGTFPNGPDVLAINVYKVTGEATNANIILRWGEAQA
tara:strand:+ start:27394 stop:33726 length:6333 start_codon:yes stop_codon:yes gene_type:complete